MRVKKTSCLHTLWPAHSCPRLAVVTINTMTFLLFKYILCCLFPYQHIDSTGNAEYILVGIHICIHLGCFDSHAGTYGFHHIHPHLCNQERSRTWKTSQLYALQIHYSLWSLLLKHQYFWQRSTAVRWKHHSGWSFGKPESKLM